MKSEPERERPLSADWRMGIRKKVVHAYEKDEDILHIVRTFRSLRNSNESGYNPTTIDHSDE